MNTRGLDWIDDLPSELAAQRGLLRGLLALCNADDRISWLVIGCSLARGAGDRLSDLDMAMGIRDEDFEAARPDLRRAVDGLGELVESYYHQLPGLTQAHERIFAQFADRSQVDLVLFPASVPGGAVPDVVVLYDPDDRLVTAAERKPVTSGQIREWAFEGTVADLDPGRLLDAARRVAALLHEAGERLPDDQRAVLPGAMARYITADLEQIRSHP
jgi:hypothetical protein